MSELRLWTDGEDFYAAASADDAATIRRGLMGDDGDDLGPLELCTDPLTMVNDDHPETRPHHEWIQMVTNGRPGYVASTNW